jgi:flagellar protein FlaG
MRYIMEIQANITGTALQQPLKPAESVDSSRKQLEKAEPDLEKSSSSESSSVQPEEILTQIKALTQEGLFSVRFEKSENSDQLIIKVVDSETGEIIRQVPAETVFGISSSLGELSGQLINFSG